jgi:hypothetical protein
MDALATLAFIAKINCGIRVQLICVEIRDSLAHYWSFKGETDGKR